MEFLLQQVSDIEYRVIQIKRRIAELKQQIGYTSNSVEPDPQTVISKTVNPSPLDHNIYGQESYNNQRASELDSLRYKLTQKK